MKLVIQEDNGVISTLKIFDDFKGRGEIAHFIAELELCKLELIELWDGADGE